ncbi:MAG: 5-(carboxyamino)imidazole ribonucleotide synthase [Gaiellales bacterium]
MLTAVLGGGQLARMLALAGHPLGVRCRVLDPSPDACAGAVAELVVAAYDDPDGLERLAAGADVVTWEFENVPAAAAALLESRLDVRPDPACLAVAQDRLDEKRLFTELGIETPRFVACRSPGDLEGRIEPPLVLKTRRLGYDGKGQVTVRTAADLEAAFAALGAVPLIAEELVAFERELSVVAARSLDGDTRVYPVVENHHRDGILRRSVAPAPGLPDVLRRRAEDHALRLLDRLGYVGVLAVELFQAGDRLLANELAPRVHNSGHWTIEGCDTSQFENHLRAVLGLPLGSAALREPCTMVNLIGRVPDRARVLAIPGAHLHLYGKEPRPGRKLGHVTVVGGDPAGPAAVMRLAGET